MIILNEIQEPIYLLDFETQSEVPISNPLYTCHESTKALMMSYGLMGSKNPKMWWQGEPCPADLRKHAENGGLLGASNATFDRQIWNNICVDDHDFPETDLGQWICTQAQCRVAGLPSALDKAARALGMKQRKDHRGKELIKRCSIPPFSTEAQDYADFGAYCLQDWVVMDAVARAIPMLTVAGLDDYQYNEELNERGIRIDRELARAASNYAEVERAEINEKLAALTMGYAEDGIPFIDSCTQHARVCKWLRECLEDDGQDAALKLMKRHKTNKETKEVVVKWSSDKNVRANLLAGQKDFAFFLADDIVELLQLMDDAGGSAVSKFAKMDQMADPDDDRVRGAIRFAGAASTQRFSSIQCQVHNYRRDALSMQDTEHYRAQMIRGVDLVDRAGNPARVMDTLGRLLRPTIIPAPGKVFVVGDWNAIESRRTAHLAGDEDKLDMFRRGECPYCYAASALYGRPISKENDPDERQMGKILDLSGGFLGGEGALASMATQFRVHIPPDKRPEMIQAFRAKHPKIVDLGDRLTAAAGRAVMNPNLWQTASTVKYLFNPKDDALYCRLSDGQTTLRYPDCRYEMKPVPWDDDELRPQLTALKAAFTPAADAKEWPRHSLWRGLLLENCCSKNTQVLTNRGWVYITAIENTDLIWDGVEFVKHDGLAQRGIQYIIKVWGVEMTPDHEVLTNEGWVQAGDVLKAQRGRFNRGDVRLPNGFGAYEKGRRPKNALLVVTMRLRQRAYSHAVRLKEGVRKFLRLSSRSPSHSEQRLSWYECPPRLRGVAQHERPLQTAYTSSLEKLRGSWHYSMRAMAGDLRKFLVRHGVDLRIGTYAGPNQKQPRVLPQELPMDYISHPSTKHATHSNIKNALGGYEPSPSFRARGAEHYRSVGATGQGVGSTRRAHPTPGHAEEVFDILNCGPRQRFVVKGDDGPAIVHNCVQAECAALLKECRLDCEDADLDVVFDVHDELVLEVDECDAEHAVAALQEIMERQRGWLWGLPLTAEPVIMYRYGK